MSIDTALSDTNYSSVDAVEVMGMLNMAPYDLSDPARFGQFRDVMDYLGKVPNKRFFVSKAVGNKQVDRLKHVWEYVELHKKKDGARKQLAQLDEEIGIYEK